MNNLLRVYFDPADIGEDGYPVAWHKEMLWPATGEITPPIKVHIRQQAGNRCVRCGHPYQKGAGEWSPCDDLCTHGEPMQNRTHYPGGGQTTYAQWRILTVHHLNRVKHDCRWWNLAALCQRCHLTIQAKVYLERRWHREHSEWFKPYAAGWYAWSFLGEELTREQTMARLEDLLALEDRQLELA